MQLEVLANEIILDLFEYLEPAHLLQAFHKLNIRFNKLLFYYFRTHTLDFQSVSDIDFDIVCRQHLSSIVDQITSLRLSDNDNIPYQIDHFLAHGFTFRAFTRLQSLTLDFNSSKQVQEQILFELQHLPTELTQLTVILNNDYYFLEKIDGQCESLVNIIWSLPKLIRCKIDLNHFPMPTNVSTSLEYLSIVGRCCYSSHNLTHLFEYTPHLRQLTLPMQEPKGNHDELSLSLMTSILTLNIGFNRLSTNTIINFFQKMSNLSKLTFYMVNSYIDGEKLEQIIRHDLIKLKILRFRMSVILTNSPIIEKVNELLKSYSTPFWLEQHRWFVRCDWQTNSKQVYLYTLPYAFHDYCFDWSIKSQSTCSLDHAFYYSYNQVKNLRVQYTTNQESLLPNVHFSNIDHLSLSFRIGNRLESLITNFANLTSLYVMEYNHNPKHQSQLQVLLDRLFHLHRLHFYAYAYSTWPRPPFELKHTSVRELGLIHIKYNNQQCTALARSPIGMQCEVLYIHVKNRACILDLIKTMANLRFLYVQCYENRRNRRTLATTDQVIEWLQPRISSQWTIARKNYNSIPLLFWIRRQSKNE